MYTNSLIGQLEERVSRLREPKDFDSEIKQIFRLLFILKASRSYKKAIPKGKKGGCQMTLSF